MDLLDLIKSIDEKCAINYHRARRPLIFHNRIVSLSSSNLLSPRLPVPPLRKNASNHCHRMASHCSVVVPEEYNFAVLVATLVTLIILHTVQKHLIGPKFSATYSNLDHATRFDWDQRVLNIAFQLPQTFFNGYVLFFCPETTIDPLWAYPSYANTCFVIIIGFYLYDSVLFVTHPRMSHSSAWIFHHLFALLLLTWQVCFQKTSALPASIFLVSASSHIFNELRWFLRATRISSFSRCANVLSLSCNLVMFATCIVPPPYLIVMIARQRSCAVLDVFFVHMRRVCRIAFLLVWLPHCVMVFVQVRRTMRHWSFKIYWCSYFASWVSTGQTNGIFMYRRTWTVKCKRKWLASKSTPPELLKLIKIYNTSKVFVQMKIVTLLKKDALPFLKDIRGTVVLSEVFRVIYWPKNRSLPSQKNLCSWQFYG